MIIGPKLDRVNRPLEKHIEITGWTNVNLLCLPDSIEIASLEGLTLRYPEINQSKQLLA